jgi:hypothetical protein
VASASRTPAARRSPSPRSCSGRSTDGIDWGAKDGPATLVFLIAAPAGGGDAHMQMLPKLARALMKKDFKAALAAATTEAEVVRIVEAEVSLDSAPQGTGAAEVAAATAASLPRPRPPPRARMPLPRPPLPPRLPLSSRTPPDR